MLDRHGFHVVEAKDFDSFDNALVLAQSKDVRLKIIRGRSFVAAELAPVDQPDSWRDVNLVRSMLSGTDEAADAPPHELAAFLDEHYTDVAGALRPAALPQTNQRLQQLAQTRFEKMFPDSARTRHRS